MKGKFLAVVLVCMGMMFLGGCASTVTGGGMGHRIINAPVDEVFDYMSNPNNLMKCDPNIKEVRNIQGEGEGMNFEAISLDAQGNEVKGYGIITEYVPNKKLVGTALTSDGLGIQTMTIIFVPIDESSTRVDMLVTGSAIAPVANKEAIETIFKEARSGIEKNADCLKRQIEK